MTGALIATTQKASVHALAFQGIMVYTCYPQISDMLRRKFGDDFVLLFAQPVENKETGEIDWYTPIYGKAQKVDSLPEDARSAACDKASNMGKEIQAFADELIHSPDPLKVTRGNILSLALCYPDISYLYVIGEQPVFVCWGFGPGTPGVEPQNLSRLVASKPKPVQQPQKPSPAPLAPKSALSWHWLWWLLPLCLACLLFFALFTSFGSQPPLAGTSLFKAGALPFANTAVKSHPDIAALENELSALRMRLDQHIALCIPQEPRPARPAMPNAQIPPTREPGESLVIPEKSQDTSFLEGEWLCDTGLINMRTSEPVKVLFAFDHSGKGRAVIFEKKDKCIGAANAKMITGALKIDVQDLHCEKSGDSYNRMSITCKSAAGSSTQCIGMNPNGHTWNADFKKIK